MQIRSLIAWLLFVTAVPAAPVAAAEAASGEGVNVGRKSTFTGLVPAGDVERGAAQQFDDLKRQAREKRALAPDNHPQLRRLRAIAAKMLPFATQWNERAKDWKWEVILIGSNQINAFCMPGGKIAFYTGIIDTLKLTDDEIAAVMGHEIAHALREHARERMGKQTATSLGANLASRLLGLGDLGNMALGAGVNLLSLKFSRDDETEADAVGLELAARAGYNPSAGITLWRKMQEASKGAPPQWLSTHPAGESRIREIENRLPQVMPLYERAKSTLR